MRGNLVDMAVGIVIGAAFGAVSKSFIEGVFMPLVGLIFQTEDFNHYYFTIGKAKVLIGTFLGAVINFVIVAFVMFLVIKGMNAMKRKKAEAPAAPPEPTNEEKLLTEIRDLLKK